MKRILLIDQSETNATLKRSLEDIHRQILVAANEKQALDILEKRTVDIILFDPVQNKHFLKDRPQKVPNPEIGGVGFVFFTKIQTLSSGMPKLVLMTKVTKDNLTRAGFPAGIPYLRKPVAPKEIVHFIEAA
jgi:DNA-binding response OmpR family regulator